MRFAFFVAISHLRSRRNEAGISVITAVSMVGVTVGVMALIMVLAVMEGFEIDLRDKILGSNAHLIALNYNGSFDGVDDSLAKLDQLENIEAAAPFVYSEMMIKSSQAASGVVFKGIDLERTPLVTDVLENIELGPDGPALTPEAKAKVVLGLIPQTEPDPKDNEEATKDDSFNETENDEAPAEVEPLIKELDPSARFPGILIGRELAKQLWVGVGDVVHIINPIGGSIGIMGVPTPDVRSFRVAGVFHSGMYEYDTKWTYVEISQAQKFLKLGESVNGIEMRLRNIDEAPLMSAFVSKALEYPFYVRHWMELNAQLFSALKLEKIVMGLILSLIVMVASLNIVGTLILVVLTRGREISILRAMGASSKQILRVFMMEGLIIGAVGTFVGTVLGLLGCWALDSYQFPLDTDVYYMDTLPVVVEPPTVLFVMVAALLISFLATIYPATVASKMNPVEGLRYD